MDECRRIVDCDCDSGLNEITRLVSQAVRAPASIVRGNEECESPLKSRLEYGQASVT